MFGRGELVEVDVLFGNALGLEEGDGGVDHRRRAAQVRVDVAEAVLETLDDLGDQTALPGPAVAVAGRGQGGDEREAGQPAPELLELLEVEQVRRRARAVVVRRRALHARL